MLRLPRRRNAAPDAPTLPATPAPTPTNGVPPLPAELLKRLEFRVLRRLDGFLFGDYRGLFYGPSLDLAEVREYQPGDEVRRIDWNVTARTGTVHVRQYREEREIIAWLLVDLSPSMAFGTRRLLKRDEALEFAALAAMVITRHGDKVGAIGFSPAKTTFTPLGSGRRQAHAIVQALLSHNSTTPSTRSTRSTRPPASPGAGDGRPAPVPPAATDLESALALVNRTLRRRALVFVISDFLSPDAAAADTAGELSWARAFRRLAQKHDVIAVRVTDPAERKLPRVGDLRLRDPESGRELWIDTNDPRVRKAHAALVAQRERAIARTFEGARVDELLLSTAHDIIEPILRFTKRRQGRRG